MWVLTSIFARKCLFCRDRVDIRECVQKRVTTPAANTDKHKSAQFYIVAHHLIIDSK